MTAEIDELLTTTRSVRKSLDLTAAVDIDEIRECLRIGMQAPNGSNEQSWRWLVVTDDALRKTIADLYRETYLGKVGGAPIAGFMPGGTPESRLMTSTEWLVEHLAEVPVFVIPCYEPSYPRTDGDESFHLATLYGSIFPAVWNFQLALRTRGYGTCTTRLRSDSSWEFPTPMCKGACCRSAGCGPTTPRGLRRAGHYPRWSP
jgi:nitroreductase